MKKIILGKKKKKKKKKKKLYIFFFFFFQKDFPCMIKFVKFLNDPCMIKFDHPSQFTVWYKIILDGCCAIKINHLYDKIKSITFGAPSFMNTTC